MRAALKVNVHQEVTVLDLDAPEGSLAVLQAGVDGWIEPVAINENLTMYVNEEGKLELFAIVNRYANALFAKRFGVGIDTIVGDVVFTGGVDDEGETIGLTDAQVRSLTFQVTGKFPKARETAAA